MGFDDREDRDPREVGKLRAMARANKGRPKLKVLPPRLREVEPRLKPLPYKKPKRD